MTTLTAHEQLAFHLVVPRFTMACVVVADRPGTEPITPGELAH
jgi:hypothetical protein